MRSPCVSLALLSALAAAACAPSGYTVVQAPAPARRLPPPPPPPLEVNIVRPDGARVLVQTNRPAYLAIFEIVPNRGVALVYPASTRQQNAMFSGLNWVSVWWTMPAPPYSGRFSGYDARPERYVYAIASDRPLRIYDSVYDSSYMRRMLGPAAYGASNPYTTVRALSRQFVPAIPAEQWGEDMYTVALTAARDPRRVARVYCPDGTVFEVREDMASRVWCPPPQRTRPGYPAPPRVGPPTAAPDSVVAPNGRPVVQRPFDPNARQPIYRVPATVGEIAQPPKGDNVQPPRSDDPRRGDDKADRERNDRDKGDKAKDHDDNGRRAHGDPVNADPRGQGNGRGSGHGDAPRTDPQTQEVKQQGEPAKNDKSDKDQKADKTDKPDNGDKADKPKADKPDNSEKADKPKDEKPKDEKPKDEKPKDEKPRDEKPKEEKAKDDDKPKPDKKASLDSLLLRRGPKRPN